MNSVSKIIFEDFIINSFQVALKELGDQLLLPSCLV